MRVSVIIPFFNRIQMVTEATQSVLEQTTLPMELILVDDGSTEEVSFTNLPPFVQLHSIPHQGVSAARNYGVEQASGDWLCFLDSDDLWHPKKLESQINFHQQNPQYAISQCREIWIRNGKRVNPSFKYVKSSGDLFADSLGQCAVSPSTVMMKRELFESYGPFDSDIKACEDYDLWLKITAKEQVGLIPEELMTRRGGHEDQLSFQYPAMDRFRVYSMLKLLLTAPLSTEQLTPEQQAQTEEVLQEKFRVLELGAAKRGRDLSQVSAVMEAVREDNKKAPQVGEDLLNIARLHLLNEWE